MHYQERYLKHQAKKKEQLAIGKGEKCTPLPTNATLQRVLSFRRSQRVFNGENIPDSVFNQILESATTAPNSCNRHGIRMKVVAERYDKEFVSGLLIGGVGWIHRADKIVSFWADKTAYASPNEKAFMHYCDVGFTAMNMWLTAESLNVGASYINPNTAHPDVLAKYFGASNHIFCGALVFGYYDKDKRAVKSEPGDLKDMML